MKLNRVFETLPQLAEQKIIPQGVIDEGRIFALGSFCSANLNHDRIVDVVDGLEDQVLQPFTLHPWAFVLDYSTSEADGGRVTVTMLEVVRPQGDGGIHVSQYLLSPKKVIYTAQLVFQHTGIGTRISITDSAFHEKRCRRTSGAVQLPACNCYPEHKRLPDRPEACAEHQERQAKEDWKSPYPNALHRRRKRVPDGPDFLTERQGSRYRR